ncbi:ABC transporter, partial [Glaesserella parasuis]|nr:ABC transporter [Glaesserella parasuis]
VESALARFVPIFESMGWVSLDESKFFYKKGLLLESENINYLLNCLGDMIYNKYIDFCTISNIESSINKDEIIDSLKSEFNEEDTDFIRECLELYDMKRFIYEIK